MTLERARGERETFEPLLRNGAIAPGKSTLTQRLSRAGAPLPGAAPADLPAPTQHDAATRAVQRRQTDRALLEAVGFLGGGAPTVDASCDADAAARDPATGLSQASVATHAARGVRGGGGPLPHLDAIQRAFGPSHDLSGVRAHVGGEAASAAHAIGAHAYATGDDIAFAAEPDLFLAAHEAAHVVQQRQGVHLKGAVGQVGDAYEQHADAVAAAVVRGESVAALLGGGAASAAGGEGAVQRKGQGDASSSAAGGAGKGGAGKGTPKVSIALPMLHVEGAPFRDGAYQLKTGASCKVRLDWDKRSKQRPEELTVQARETGDGQAASLGAFDVSKGAWDGPDVVWDVTANAPGTTTVDFRVFKGELGLVLEKEMTFVSSVKGGDLKLVDLVQDAELRVTKRMAQASEWAMGLIESYSNARARMTAAISKDDAKAALVESLFWGAVTVVGGAVAGPLAKVLLGSGGSALSGVMGDFITALKEDLASDSAKFIVGAVSTAAQGLAAIEGGESDGTPREPLTEMLKLQKCIARWQVDVAEALEVMKANLRGAATIDVEPRHVVDLFFDGFGFPWSVPASEDFERAMWKTWLGKNMLESWMGLNRTATMARLDALGVPYVHPDAPNEDALDDYPTPFF